MFAIVCDPSHGDAGRFNQAIPNQRRQVGPDRIVGEVEGGRQPRDALSRTAEQLKHLVAGFPGQDLQARHATA
jgi:hypothetical protein